MLNVVQEKSRGGEISDENLEIVKSLAQRMLDMLDLRKNLEDHLEKEMNNVAPNLAIILGTGVAARMLSRTGSLKKLSSLPASTIQVLGAERALFRSPKTSLPHLLDTFDNFQEQSVSDQVVQCQRIQCLLYHILQNIL